jgi:hypothetical protein
VQTPPARSCAKASPNYLFDLFQFRSEAAEIKDKAAALQAYARQREDRDLEVWMSEIKLRASVRIGELVRELETAQGERTELRPANGRKLKADASPPAHPNAALQN